VKEAYELDKINGDNFWRDAIAKEMKNVKIAFDILEDGHQVEPGCKFLECYMIFDVKMCLRGRLDLWQMGLRPRTQMLPLMLASYPEKLSGLY